MALIKCPECGKEISSYSDVCIGCGYPIKEMSISNKKEEAQENICENKYGFNNCVLDVLYSQCNEDKIKMVKLVRQGTTLSLAQAKEIVDIYWENHVTNNSLTIQNPQTETQIIPKKEFHGIYRYTVFGGKQEVYCPRCGSQDCSHYQQEKIIPGKTKTRYTMNLNPLRPFTLVNKKEKVVTKDKYVTEDKIICNSCGYIF